MRNHLVVIIILSSCCPALGNDKPAPEGGKPVRTDLYGDPLPDGAVARLGSLRWRTGKSGYASNMELLAFALNDNTLACAAPLDVWFFDKTNGKLTKHLSVADGHTWIERFAFSSDGTRLACSSMVPGNDNANRVVQIWDLRSWRKVQEFDAERLQWLGWSSDDQPLAVLRGRDGMIFFRELATGKERCFPLQAPPDWLSSCAYAAGKKLLAVPDECVIHVWDAATGEKRCTLQTNGMKEDSTRILAFSPDGCSLASAPGNRAYNNGVQLWDVASGKVKHTVAAEQEMVMGVAFAPDGKTIATAGESDVRLWDVGTGRERSRMSWNLPQEQKRFRMSGGPSFGQSVVFSRDGKTLVTSETYSGAIHLWDVATGALKPEPVGHTKEPCHVAFSPDGGRVASGGSFRDGAIYIWDPATGEALTRIRRQEWVRGCAFSTDGRILYTCWTGNKLYFLDAATGRELHSVNLDDSERPEPEQMGWGMWLSADGRTLLADSVNDKNWNEPRLLTAWDTATRKPLFRRKLDPSIWGAISADGKVLAVGSDGLAPAGAKLVPSWNLDPVQLQDLATGKQLLVLPALKRQTQPLGFSPDGRLLITASSVAGVSAYSLRLWDVATAAELHALPMRTGYDRLTSCAAFSPDGRVLALPSASQAILLWDVWRSKELRRIEGFGAEVVSQSGVLTRRKPVGVRPGRQHLVGLGCGRNPEGWQAERPGRP